MPAYSTHYIFAKELKEEIENCIDFKLNDAALFIGTQGPDIFFDHRVMPWMIGKSMRKIGSLLHRAKPSDILDKMREYINLSESKDIAKSYAAGFILHYALDRSCHPYVYALQNKMVEKYPHLNSHTAHNTIEFSMDTYLLTKRLKAENAYLFDTEGTIIFNEAELDELAKMISYVTSNVTNKQVTPNDVKTAIKDLKYIQKLTTDKSGKKENLVKIIDGIVAPFLNNFKFSALMRPKDLEKAKKYGNIENRNWRSPYAPGVRTESFFDLYRLAKAPAQEMIRGFDRICAGETDGAAVSQNISFLTGVELK